MCGCGRKRVTEQVTSVQAAQEADAARAALEQAEAAAISEAETYAKSAAAAIANSRYTG